MDLDELRDELAAIFEEGTGLAKNDDLLAELEFFKQLHERLGEAIEQMEPVTA